MNQVDMEQVTNEITTVILAIFDTTFTKFMEPTNSHQNKLFKIVIKKQLHTRDTHREIVTTTSNMNTFWNYILNIKQYTSPKLKGEVLQAKAWELQCCLLPCIIVVGVGCTFEFATHKHSILIILFSEIRNEMWALWFHKLEPKKCRTSEISWSFWCMIQIDIVTYNS